MSVVAEVVKNLPVWESKGCKRFFLSEGGFKIVSGQDQIKSRRLGGDCLLFDSGRADIYQCSQIEIAAHDKSLRYWLILDKRHHYTIYNNKVMKKKSIQDFRPPAVLPHPHTNGNNIIIIKINKPPRPLPSMLELRREEERRKNVTSASYLLHLMKSESQFEVPKTRFYIDYEQTFSIFLLLWGSMTLDMNV